MRRPSTQRATPHELPTELGRVPADAPIALFIPSLHRATAEAGRALRLARSVDDDFDRSLSRLIAEEVWGAYRLAPLTKQKPIDLDRVLTPQGLEDAGLDAEAPLLLLPNLTDGVLVVRFGLKDRARFERWLDRIGGAERQRVDLAGESASVLVPDSDRPVTCVARKNHAVCQVGVNAGANPIADLARFLSGKGRTYAALPGVVSSFLRLPQDASFYLLAHPAPLGATIGKLAHHRAGLRARFADRATKRRVAQHAAAMQNKVERWAAHLDGIAFAVLTDTRKSIRAEVSATPAGARLLKEALPRRSTSDLIGRWTNTPALISLLVHANPGFVQRAAQRMGLTLPAAALNGTVGFLTLGMDPTCPAAHRESDSRRDWAFMFPSALNLGLSSERAADVIHQVLAKQLNQEEREVAYAVPRKPIAGHAEGSPYEIHVMDRMLVVGTGPGSGSAALRRIAAVEKVQASSEAAPFLQASIHPRAIDAAFAAGTFSRKHRRDLLAIEAMRLQLKPLMEQVEEVRLEARADARSRLSLRLDVR